jgi:hypothetical protein
MMKIIILIVMISMPPLDKIFWPSMKQGTLSILFVKDTSLESSCGFGAGEGDLDVGENFF